MTLTNVSLTVRTQLNRSTTDPTDLPSRFGQKKSKKRSNCKSLPQIRPLRRLQPPTPPTRRPRYGERKARDDGDWNSPAAEPYASGSSYVNGDRGRLQILAFQVAAKGAAQGAAIGALMGTLNNATPVPPPPPGAALNSQALASLQQVQALAVGPLVQARNFAVMSGVNVGISSVMKRVRGKQDIESSMVAAFGSGAAFSVVSGKGGSNLAAHAVSSGLFFALIQGGLFKAGEKFSKAAPPSVDPY